jgi:hypothetical protein
MTCTYRRRFAAALVLALLFSATATAQTKQALEIVPDDALGFILVKDMQQLSAHVEELAKKVKAQAHVSLLELLRDGMGLGNSLNEKGSAMIIALKGKDDKAAPALVFVLPVSDATAALKKLGAKEGKDGIMEASIPMPPGVFATIGKKEAKPKDGAGPVLVAKREGFILLYQDA